MPEEVFRPQKDNYALKQKDGCLKVTVAMYIGYHGHQAPQTTRSTIYHERADF